MENYIIGAFGGLIGSILTVVISKSLEILQKSKEHKYELQRQFFLKKLAAAEATVMQCSLLSEAISQVIILYSRYEEYENDIGNKLCDNILKQLDGKIALASSASLSIANAIRLYFDFASDISKKQNVTEFYDAFNSLAPFTENVEKTFKQYLNSQGTENEQMYRNIYQNSEKDLAFAMKKIADGYVKFNTELNIYVAQIRNEMKKFEF